MARYGVPEPPEPDSQVVPGKGKKDSPTAWTDSKVVKKYRKAKAALTNFPLVYKKF